MSNFASVPDLPQNAIYFRSIKVYRYGGDRYFDRMPCRVVVVGESAKSFRIRYEGRETWVRKQKIKIICCNRYCLISFRPIPLKTA